MHLLGDETALYADAAYSSQQTRDKLEQFGIADQVQRKGYRNKLLSAEDKRRNDVIAVIRAGGERPFATYKSRYGLSRTRFMGLAKNMTAYFHTHLSCCEGNRLSSANGFYMQQITRP
jgi:IS5 family transposase